MSACKTITELSKKYDELYAKASKILDDFNPCKIENGTCLSGRSGGRNFCCEGCPNLSQTGCTVKCIFCRTWICEEAAAAMGESYKAFNELMTRIDDEAREYGMLVFRTGKEEIMQTIPICNKCGRPAASKPSGYGYDVFLVKDGCGCGGEFVVRRDGKPTLPADILPQCLKCSIATRCDENTLYIPCKVTCIMTGVKLNAS
jgi:hypothetical protein